MVLSLRRTPYSADESRIEDYLATLGVGRGLPDPIGFLMVSHATMMQRMVSIAGIQIMKIGPCEIVRCLEWSLDRLAQLDHISGRTEEEQNRFGARMRHAREMLRHATR